MLLKKIVIDKILIRKDSTSLFIKNSKKTDFIPIFLILKYLSNHSVLPLYVFMILKRDTGLITFKKNDFFFFLNALLMNF